MDSQKLSHEQQMVAEAAAAGFCRPPREKRTEYFGRTTQARHDGFRGHEYQKFLNEQQAIEQAEAAGFCIPRDPSKPAREPQWDLRVRSRALEERVTPKDVWNGSGDAPRTEFCSVTSRISSDSSTRVNGDDDDDTAGPPTCTQTSEESLIQYHPFKKLQATEEVPRPTPPVLRHSALTTTTVLEKEPSFPEVPLQKTNGGGMSTITITVLALLYGFMIFGFAEYLFQRSCNKNVKSRRAEMSLLRLIIDDIIYVATRRFSDK